jgi:hypothetical protein
MLQRSEDVTEVWARLREFPVVAILGPRQVGKTTLARQVAKSARGAVHHFDLEDPADEARLGEAGLALRDLSGLVVLDEIQRRPDLFPLLRVLSDRPKLPARFLVLGSAAPELLRQGAETLAGRIHFHELAGFGLREVGRKDLDRLWLRGGYPPSFLAADDEASFRWRTGLVRTYLERDIPELGLRVPASTLRRFWTMIAHTHGTIWNASELGRAFGVADTTVRRYLDLLTATFTVRQLQPWHANLSKRQVKSPKVYVADSGLLHRLLDIRKRRDLDGHVKVGASWEGFLLGQVLRRLRVEQGEAYYWATYSGAELDLLVVRGSTRLGFEFKRTDAPAITPSMRSALADLELDQLDVVHAGRETFALGERVRAVAAVELVDRIAWA